MGDGGEDSELSSHLLLLQPDTPAGGDGFEDVVRTCTHTHTCNPPGPTAEPHTHTCYHTHTQLLSPATAAAAAAADGGGRRRPLGNREAVRKYREKKKAHAAFLEEEVKKLRLANQQLLRRLQGQAALEAELLRLRALLAAVRARIDAELGVFPYQKPCAAAAGFRCDPATAGWGAGCTPAADCRIELDGCIGHDLDASGGDDGDAVGSLMSLPSESRV